MEQASDHDGVGADQWRWWAVAVAGVVVVGLGGCFGRRIIEGAASRRGPGLAVPVLAYLVIISTMTMSAAAAGNSWAVIGAGLFLASDTILGWRQFVSVRRWMPVAIMVTYHLAQGALVVSLALT